MYNSFLSASYFVGQKALYIQSSIYKIIIICRYLFEQWYLFLTFTSSVKGKERVGGRKKVGISFCLTDLYLLFQFRILTSLDNLLYGEVGLTYKIKKLVSGVAWFYFYYYFFVCVMFLDLMGTVSVLGRVGMQVLMGRAWHFLFCYPGFAEMAVE